MKEYLIAIGIGAGLATSVIYIFQNRNRKPSRTGGDDIHCRQRCEQTANGTLLRERQDQIGYLENQFFLGMDKKMNLSSQQINRLKGHLKTCVNNQELFDNALQLCDILKGMAQIKLIGPRTYSRISTALRNVDVDPAPIAVNIARLSDAVADVRGGVQQRDYGADVFEYDGVIIHCEDDRDEVLDFINHITALVDVADLLLCSLDEYQTSKPQLQRLSNIYAETRYIYVFVTENLNPDSFNRYIAEMALTDSLLDPLKNFRIIPIWARKERIRILELLPLPGFKYWWYFNSDKDREKLRVSFRKHVIDGRYEIQQAADTS